MITTIIRRVPHLKVRTSLLSTLNCLKSSSLRPVFIIFGPGQFPSRDKNHLTVPPAVQRICIQNFFRK